MDLTTFVTLAEKVGLGIVMSGFVGIILFYVIRQIMAAQKADREVYVETVKAKDTTLNNHIAHLTVSNGEIKETIIELIGKNDAQKEAIETMGDKIVAAIHDQNELMKEIARNNK